MSFELSVGGTCSDFHDVIVRDDERSQGVPDAVRVWVSIGAVRSDLQKRFDTRRFDTRPDTEVNSVSEGVKCGR